MDLTNKNGRINGISMGYSWNVHGIFHGNIPLILHESRALFISFKHPKKTWWM